MMNRHERRRQEAWRKRFNAMEQVPQAEAYAALAAGRSVHILMGHDGKCLCSTGQYDTAYCTCEPDVTCFLHPEKATA